MAQVITDKPKKGWLRLAGGKDVHKNTIKGHIAMIDAIPDEALRVPMSTAFAGLQGIDLPELEEAILLVSAESSTQPGTSERKYAWRDATRRIQNGVLEMENYFLSVKTETIDNMKAADAKNLIKEMQFRLNNLVEISAEYPNPIIMTLMQTTKISEACVIDLATKANPERLLSVAQVGWGDGSKVPDGEAGRGQYTSPRTNVVGSKQGAMVGSDDGTPSELPDAYGSGKSVPDSRNKSGGYIVLWTPPVWDGKTLTFNAEEDKPTTE